MAGGISHRGDASSVGAAAFAPALSIGRAAARLFALVCALVQRMRALRLSSVLVVLAACSLSACGVFQQQTPAPIVEHSYIPGPSETETNEPEEPAPVVTVPEPASAVKPAPAPKPKRRVVKPKPPEPVVTPPPEPPEPPPPPQIISTRLMQHDQLHGLLDAEVQRPDGKVVGRAVDLYVDPSAKPRLLMVNLSGFMGIGDRKVNFPWTAFRFTPNSKTAPITFLPPPPPAKGKPAADPVPKPQPVSEAPSNFMQLVDSTVTQKNGARIGRVVDVLVDSQAQPQALVVDLSSSLAAEKRHVAVNWGDLQVVSRNKQLALQMDFNDAQLKAAPTYAPEQPIKIVSPVVPAPASSAAASGAASGAGSASSGGTTASGAVAAQTPSSGARPAR
ncbi:PRC-barrel domain-containing protein [Caballeronia sp. GAFFF1]|uniref:PRC-barrel domain-containing protein n=1 Tax=Caballeronia sp. GAFFF1 TaxID=2921779 RepID=UPI00202922B4|nr:PRC-barrel domain-containing protein [Caballeronia sp. GAFFF1]